MTLRLLDKAEDWALEAKTKLNAALTYLDGLQASITAQIAAAIAAAVVDATTAVKGIIEIATDAEAVAVTATDKALVPSNFAGKAGQQVYEEGTFTPGLAFGGGTTGITYTTQSGTYTRIGRIVHVTIHILLSAKGSSTGTVTVTGLPVTVGNTAPAIVFIGVMTAGVGDTYVEGVFTAGGTTMSLFDVAGGTFTALTDVDFTNTSRIRISGAYEV